MLNTRREDEENWLSAKKNTSHVNVDKLHGLLCIAASAGISISLIIWAIVALT